MTEKICTYVYIYVTWNDVSFGSTRSLKAFEAYSAGSQQFINVKPFKNFFENICKHICYYNLKLHSTWMPIFWYRCSRRWFFIRSFSNWGWWLRRSNINNSQFALINLIARLFIKLHIQREKKTIKLSCHTYNLFSDFYQETICCVPGRVAQLVS